MPTLFSPLVIKNITLKNRIVVSPMCQYSAEDGFANDWHLVHLGSRAVGGVGMVIAEATAVSPEGRISPDDLGIWKDDHIGKLAQITTFIKAQGCVAAIQLAHAGRKASTAAPWKHRGGLADGQGGWTPVAPSVIAFADNYRVPLALDAVGIGKVIADFTAAAERAWQAGFEAVEIHAAHGYLLHQFLSPLSNQRNDSYGGTFENRIRLLLEVIGAVKTVWPADFPLLVRLSATDWAEGGWDINQSVQLAVRLKSLGVDLIDVSSGGLASHQRIPVGPGYQLPFATRIKREAAVLTSAVGLITNAQQADAIVANGEADLVMMARELLRNPYFLLQASATLGHDLAWPVQYERAKPAV